MSIITISRGSYSHGREIAEKAAKKLGYECVSREVLLEASKEFNVSEVKLLEAIKDAPSFLDRFSHSKERYVAYIQAAVLKHLEKDNVVYHGFAGHFFVQHIQHVLKVRIVADQEDRIRVVMKRDGVSRSEALSRLRNIDQQRKRWGLKLYGIDTRDPSLYDLVLHVQRITVGSAVDLICKMVGLESFETTPESQKMMDDLVLSAEVKAALMQVKPDIEVSADNGFVLVRTKTRKHREEKLSRNFEEIAKNIPGINDLEIQVLSSSRVMGWS